MGIYIKKYEDIIEVNQQEIFKDLYNLGKKINDYNIETDSLDITNWDKDRVLKFSKRIWGIKKALMNLFETYTQNFYRNSEIEKEMKKLISKYGYPNNKRKDILVSYVATYKEVLTKSLYVFTIAQLLESIKKDNYYNYESKFVKISVKKKETILFYVNNIMNSQSLLCYIDYLNEFRYIFDNWCDIPNFVMYAMLSKIDNSTNKFRIISCSQCGNLFVQNGRETICSLECKKENARLRKQKSRNGKKQQKNIHK